MLSVWKILAVIINHENTVCSNPFSDVCKGKPMNINSADFVYVSAFAEMDLKTGAKFVCIFSQLSSQFPI